MGKMWFPEAPADMNTASEILFSPCAVINF